MTASSVQLLSSCRVQLIGLPQAAGASTAASPPAFAVNRISRNLFGSPQQGEIKQMLQEEMHQARERFRQRYSFDILTDSRSSSSTNLTDDEKKGNCTITTAAVDNLIAKELLQHELRLNADKCNISRSAHNASSSSASINSKLKNVANVKKTVGPSCGSFGDILKINGNGNSSNATDRLKPYARQSLLTDCFNLRKSTQCNNTNSNSNVNSTRSSSMTQRTSNGNDMHFPSAFSTHQTIQVSQLPKPKRAVLSTSVVSQHLQPQQLSTEQSQTTSSQLEPSSPSVPKPCDIIPVAEQQQQVV